MTNLGELVSVLFTKYERELHDRELAAIATQVALEEVLRERRAATGRDRARKAA